MGYKGELDISREMGTLRRHAATAVTSGASKAADDGRVAFDAYTRAQTTMHPPMRASYRPSKGGFVLMFAVSPSRPRFRHLSVTPPLKVNTTGRNRRPVVVTGWRARSVEVPRGFIYNGAILQREATGRKVVSARGYLISRGAMPSPAELLARCRADVIVAAENAIGDALIRGVTYAE